MNPLPDDGSSLGDWAVWWAQRGWLVFPLAPAGKEPLAGTRGFKDGTTDLDRITEWWRSHPTANIGASPPAGLVVVDVDGPLDPGFSWKSTQTHRTHKGRHLVYEDPQGVVPQTSGVGRLWTNCDTRVSGRGYIVLPPSMHPEGGRYSIEDLRDPVVFPYGALRTRGMGRRGQGLPAEVVRAAKKGNGLAALLAYPADHPDTGDDWLTRVAGHLARMVHDEDEYVALLVRINQSLADPLSDAAVHKKRGIWAAEQTKQESFTDRRGWLSETPGVFGYTTQTGSGRNREVVPWSSFRATARGLIDEGGTQTWLVDLHRDDGTAVESQQLSSDTLSSAPLFRRWLASRGCVVHSNNRDPYNAAPGDRLLRVLQAQSPPSLLAAGYYGWYADQGVFVTPEGELTADGLRPHTAYHPSPSLSGNVVARYGGADDPQAAVAVLREVLTFQDETEMAKIGSWLMMLLLRGQWGPGAMPGLIVESYSESGKTTLFEMITQLAGVPQGGGHRTPPVVREELNSHANGVVWLDDVAVRDGLQELVRSAVTVGETRIRDVATSFSSTKNVPLRGTVILSGEGVDFGRQKAIRDRFIEISLPSPTGRRSLHDPSQPQWYDVLALKQRYDGDLSAVAGGLVVAVLRCAARLKDQTVVPANRKNRAQALLQVGARVLSELTGENRWTQLVDQWAESDAVSTVDAASTVVLEVLPKIWRAHGFPTSAGNLEMGQVLPVWWDEGAGAFWINGGKLADAWAATGARGDRDRQLTTQLSIRRELDACGAGSSKNHRTGLSGSTGVVVSYRPLAAPYADRARRIALDLDEGNE